MHRDTIIGIVGVVILVAAMIGVFTYERGQATLSTDGMGGQTQELAGPTAEGTVAVGSTSDSDLAINATGLTNVTFTLTWTPGANSVDTLRLVAQPANDTGLAEAFESDAENDGEIVLTVPVPNDSVDDVLGTGNWRLTVEFVNSQVAGPAGPPVDPPQQVPAGDQSVAYTISTSLEAYEATG